MGNIPCRQIKDGRLDLETNPVCSGQMAQNRVEAIARACERIDDADRAVAGRTRDDVGNIAPDPVSERVFDSLETCAR